MNKYIQISIFIFLAIIISCTQDRFTVEDLRIHPQKSTDNSYNEYIIGFYPRMISGISSSGVEELNAFTEDCYANIYAYNNGNSFILSDQQLYKSMTAGTLSPVNLPIILEDGNYNIYATSIHSDQKPPSFTNYITTDINSGVDYLWALVDTINIETETNVILNFNHVACQVNLNVINQQTDTIADWINFAMLGTPEVTSSSEWNLLTGVITPSTSIRVDTLLNMVAKGLTASQYILPVSKVAEIYLYISLKLNKENEPMGYEIFLPLPDSTFLPGSSYSYTVQYGYDTIIVNDVNIAPWNIIDETSNPIYPDVN